MSDHLEDNQLIARWLSGDLSEEEQRRLSESGELDALRAALDNLDGWSLPELKLDRGLQRLKDGQKPKNKVRSLNTRAVWKYAAAAVLLVAVYLGWMLFSDDTVKYATAVGEQLEIELPDGSMAKLDAVSEIRLNAKQWDQERTISLKGQAYFDVKPGLPFSVTTKLGNVEVLGTQFNIWASVQELKTLCFQGSVLVKTKDQRVLLEAGQGAVSDKGGLRKFNHKKEQPDWVVGFSQFERAPLTEVVDELKRHFAINISLPRQHQNVKFTGKFMHHDLNLALKTIFVPLEIPYELKDDRTVVIR